MPRLGGLNDSRLFLTVLEAGKSEIRLPVWLGSGEDSVSGLWTASLLCSHMAERERERGRALVSPLSYKDTNPVIGAPSS